MVGENLQALFDLGESASVVTVKIELSCPVLYPEFPKGKAGREKHRAEVAETLESARVRHPDLLDAIERAAKEHETESSVVLTAMYVFVALPVKIAYNLGSRPDAVSVELALRWAPDTPQQG